MHQCDDIQEPNFFLCFDFLCSFIRPQIVSSAFFTLLKKKIIDGHFDTLLHFCSPGTFGKNKFLLRWNIFMGKYIYIGHSIMGQQGLVQNSGNIWNESIPFTALLAQNSNFIRPGTLFCCLALPCLVFVVLSCLATYDLVCLKSL